MTNAVVAIGGNAILKKDQPATKENQQRNLEETCRHIASMVQAGYNITLTHGNGPQVGDILIQNEVARGEVPPMPLDVCVAESQGLVGFMLQQALTDALRKACCDRIVPCVLTRVVVDEEDEAFKDPSKPVGPYYDREEAEKLSKERGWHLHKDLSRGGWRRVVPSPRPVTIVEAPAIGRLVRSGNDLVIAVGGGGIPVAWRNGRLEGVEAVVDKDLAAACLAKSLKDDLLVMLTDVEGAYVGYGTARERMLGTVTAEVAERHLEEGEFPPGSMGPKVEAAIDFVRSGGERAVITTPELLHMALASKAGTQVVIR